MIRIFEPSEGPRVFALPPGADFGSDVAHGLLRLTEDLPPEALPRVRLLTNTRRTARRLSSVLRDGSPRLLPRIGLVTELDTLHLFTDLPPSASPLSRQLELIELIHPLMERLDLPRSSAPDLASSLVALLDEMEADGVSPKDIVAIDTGDRTGHWAESVAFLNIVQEYLNDRAEDGLGPEARRRRQVDALIERWGREPPQDPIIIAGSTASRKTTARLMEAVARLPQGAVVLPGLDFELPDKIWTELTDLGAEDHPQYRLAAFLQRLELDRSELGRWPSTSSPPRNPLISLILRPAPVTDQWLRDGPLLRNIAEQTRRLSLVTAPDQRIESLAGAAAARIAVGAGKSVALITPDRTLARRVSAALRRWDIIADDSAGRPLSLTAPGRLLRLVGRVMGRWPLPSEIVAILGHPLAHGSRSERGPHLLLSRELELWMRRQNTSVVTPETVRSFAAERDIEAWENWLIEVLELCAQHPPSGFTAALDAHVAATEAVARASKPAAVQTLWEEAAGREAFALVNRMRQEGKDDDGLPFSDYFSVFEREFARENVRADENSRPDVMIWGTLEARVQGADVLILSGLNEGTWPETGAPDPWLNRALRRELGLSVPEREIGLAAHDFQQAVSAPEVVLTRAARNADSETVPSRWLSRLTNLLKGLPGQGGDEALSAMVSRGEALIGYAKSLDRPTVRTKPAPRPAPAPMRGSRPSRLSVTEIQRLIRDPYAIYAKHVLKLKKLDPLDTAPDARRRGIVFHRIFEQAFGPSQAFASVKDAHDKLIEVAQKVIAGDVSQPSARAHWMGHIRAIAYRLAKDEMIRRVNAAPFATEIKGALTLTSEIGVAGTLDRVDRTHDGTWIVYDYKSGTVPSAKAVRAFDRQLPIEALMIERGAFPDIEIGPVSGAVYLGLGRTPMVAELDISTSGDPRLDPATIERELVQLISAYLDAGKGYVSRRAVASTRFEGDFDHLARFGEWDETDEAPINPLYDEPGN